MTVSVQNGVAVVTTADETFVAAPGDLFVLGGITIPILSVSSSTQLTLKSPWPGATLSNQAGYTILKTGDYWRDSLPILSKVNELLDRITLDMPLTLPSGGTTGQVLQKLSGTNFDVGWAAVAGAGVGGSAPVNTVRPALTGTPAIGNQMTTSTGTWTSSSTLTYEYRWLRSGLAIGDATGPTYVIQEADGGNIVRSRITATDQQGRTKIVTSLPVSIEPTISVRPVANTYGIPDTVGTGINSLSTVSRHRLSRTVTFLDIVFPNFVVNNANNGVETAPGNDVSITAQLTGADNVTRDIVFNRSFVGTIPDGGMLTGRCNATLSPGFIKIAVQRTAINGTAVPTMNYTQDFAHGEFTSSAPAMYRPMAIRSESGDRVFVLIGDSRTLGVQDGNDGSSNTGLLAPAIGPKFTYVNLGVGFDSSYRFNESHTNRMALAQGCTDVIIAYGTNELFRGGPTVLETIKTLAGFFAGKPTWIATVPPSGQSSTDGFTTLEGQSGGNTNVPVFNDLLRAGVEGANVLEIADLIESSRNSLKWRVDKGPFTLEGVHEIFPALRYVARSSIWTPIVGGAPIPISGLTITWEFLAPNGSVPKNVDVGTSVASLGITGGTPFTYYSFDEASDPTGAVAISETGVITITRSLAGDTTGSTVSFTARAIDYRGGVFDQAFTITVAAPIALYASFTPQGKSNQLTLSNSNLTVTRVAGSGWGLVRGTRPATTGKRFYSATTNALPDGNAIFGFANANHPSDNYLGISVHGIGSWNNANQTLFGNGNLGAPNLGGNTGIFDMAIDLDARLFWIRRNGGSWNGNGSANPITGVGGYDYGFAGGLAGSAVVAALSVYEGGAQITANFGASAFTYPVPTGYSIF